MLAMAASYGEFLGRVAGQPRANRGDRGNSDRPKCLISCRIGVNRGEHVGSPKHAMVPGAGIEPAWGCPRRILSQRMVSAPGIAWLGYSSLWRVFLRSQAFDHIPVRDANRPRSLLLCSWPAPGNRDRKRTRLNSRHSQKSYAVFFL